MLDLRHTNPSTRTRPVRDHGPRPSVRGPRRPNRPPPTYPNHRERHPSPTAAAPSRRRRRRPSPPRRTAAPTTAAAGHAVRRVVRPGDLVALPALLTPDWQFPAQATPHAWVDLSGVVWLGTDARQVLGTDDGTVPARLRRVLADLTAGRRQPDPTNPQPPDPNRWQVALVHATR